MIPKTKKLFISYRSSDHREVDLIAQQLRTLKHADGVAKYKTWQDKHDLEAGKSWWDGIIDAIIDCDIFVFHLSPAYFASQVCVAELNYAIERNRPIIPVVLESAYFLKPGTRKPEIDFWDDLPDGLSKYQFLFYNHEDFFVRFERAVALHEANWPPDISIRRPINPDENAIHGNNYAVYATATDRALQLVFDEAKPLFRELVQRNDLDFAEIGRQWLILLDRYQDLLDAKKHRAPRTVFQRKWNDYIDLFPFDFIDDLYPDAVEQPIIFDPKNLNPALSPPKKKPTAPLPSPSVSVSQTQAPAPVATPRKPTSLSLMPAPFDWIEIPAGRGTMKTYDKNVILTIPTEPYWIAKYPVTNAQFAKFIEAGGYKNKKWWTEQGWQQREKDEWTKPRYWGDSTWNSAQQPVVGVSWYECVAFCLWLSDLTGEKIMLPTEAHWQYAAQGDDGRDYPWGNNWDASRCNNNVDKKGLGKTTSVTHYEGKSKGDSPFGVVDMVGNVWEWCLTDYTNQTNDLNSETQRRVLRGGSWFYLNTGFFRCDFRFWYIPYNGSGNGFRCARSYE
ncbi:hypothetical protein MASR2M15_09760 [Anaerolineales bacterium]